MLRFGEDGKKDIIMVMKHLKGQYLTEATEEVEMCARFLRWENGEND